jgi:DedD protein
MDHELKQRLIGAIVVTALAAIFVPMLFDDPVDSSSQQVSELQLPKAPNDIEKISEKQLPEDLGRALTPDENPATGSETKETNNLAAAETPEQKAAPENNADEELIAVESETEDSPVRKPTKAREDNLDTGDVSLEDGAQPDNEDAAPVTHKATSHAKTATIAQETKVAKTKPKSDSAEQHKTVSKAKEPDTAEVEHKEKAKTNAGLSRWSIQAGSFSKKENAEAMLAKLQKQGFPVTLQAKGNIYRLKIGPELDKQRAADMKKRLDKQNIQSLLISE